MDMHSTINEILDELERADKKHGPMAEPIEGWFTLLIEVLELGREVLRKDKDDLAVRIEALHSASMGVKFLRDICYGGKNGKEMQG